MFKYYYDFLRIRFDFGVFYMGGGEGEIPSGRVINHPDGSSSQVTPKGVYHYALDHTALNGRKLYHFYRATGTLILNPDYFPESELERMALQVKESQQSPSIDLRINELEYHATLKGVVKSVRYGRLGELEVKYPKQGKLVELINDIRSLFSQLGFSRK
ncbi:hypothetical protein J4448_07260 [Candidatus Woesearchaeota archaeon]|nr:hypothetical protein [Candidatus Woesearchaeota archaeon]